MNANVSNKLKLWIFLQVEKLMYMEPRKKTRELKNMIRCSVKSPATHSFMLLTDNFQGLNEVGHVVNTRFQHLL
jgi:hypothetical protein